MIKDLKGQTLSLAKAIYYTTFSIQYLDDVKLGLSGEPKEFIGGLVNRQQIVLRSLYHRMPESTATLLRNEIENTDISSMDSIMNLLVTLDERQRLEMETYIENLIKEKGNANQRGIQ